MRSQEELLLSHRVFDKTISNVDPSPDIKLRPKRNPIWVDEDDTTLQIDLKSKSALKKLRHSEKEEKVSSEILLDRLEEKSIISKSADWINERKTDKYSDIFRTTESLIDSESRILSPGQLQVCRMKDANQHAPSKCVIQALEFHQNGQIMLTGGYDKTLRLFNIDGLSNSSIQNIFIPDLPIDSASFTFEGDRIVLSGRRSYFYSYDLSSGKSTKIPRIIGKKENNLDKFCLSNDGKYIVFLGSNGYLNLLSAKSFQWIGQFKINGSVTSACFSDDSKYLYCCGTDGDVYKWEVGSRRCCFKRPDEGCSSGLCISTSRCGSYYAVGTESGVVNIYDAKNDIKVISPLKSLMHLTTPTNNLVFNHDSQILAMSSKYTKDSLKMLHLPSLTVFSNWPTAKTPLHYVSKMAFSPHSGFLACGNDRGRVLLYRLNHYNKI